MLTLSRVTVVDDNELHLTGIVKSLNQLRIGCYALLYSDDDVHDWKKLPGTRILILDQHLSDGVAVVGSDEVRFSALADVILKLICPDSGPYGLILWAGDPALDALKTFLFERFTDSDSRYLPLFFSVLQKSDYIDVSDGRVLDSGKLENDIKDSIRANSKMQALVAWESDVSVAADAVLRSIVNLVASEKRNLESHEEDIGKVLYQLSQTGAGAGQACKSPREAINRVLVPILSDRILAHDPDAKDQVSWRDALVKPTERPTLTAQASLNSAMHLSPARSLPDGTVSVRPTDLGSVVRFPHGKIEDALEGLFGINEKELRGGLFRAKKDEWTDCKIRLIQIGASCDQAQPKPGPLLYLLGIEWTFAKADGGFDDDKPSMWLGDDSRFGRSRPSRASEWQSPVLEFPYATQPGKLSVYKNLSISAPRSTAGTWSSVYRLREDLIGELTQEYARYISRPGILSLPS